MKTVAIIQARLQSTRLPAKVLSDIAGKTMLERVVHRTQQATKVDQVVVATSDASADHRLIEYCRQQGWDWIAGSEHDVLSRYVKAAKAFDADYIVRITSDCPLIDPELIDQVVSTALAEQADYCCNFFPLRHFPRGLDCETLTRRALLAMDRLAEQPRYREHVTLYMYDQAVANGGKNRSGFSYGSVLSPEDHSGNRWTVDTWEDLQLVRRIYEHFEAQNFCWQDVLQVIEAHPSWAQINQGMIQKVA